MSELITQAFYEAAAAKVMRRTWLENYGMHYLCYSRASREIAIKCELFAMGFNEYTARVYALDNLCGSKAELKYRLRAF